MPSHHAQFSQEIMIANEEVRRQTILSLTLKIRVPKNENHHNRKINKSAQILDSVIKCNKQTTELKFQERTCSHISALKPLKNI